MQYDKIWSFFMYLSIGRLQIEEKNVRIGQHLFDGAVGDVAGRIHSRMDPVFLEFAQQFGTKIGMIERFSARQGHAAAGMIVEGFILEDFCKHFFDRRAASFPADGSGRTDCCARTAEPAERIIHMQQSVFQCSRMRRTGRHAFHALQALSCIQRQLQLHALGFGICTPSAV